MPDFQVFAKYSLFLYKSGRPGVYEVETVNEEYNDLVLSHLVDLSASDSLQILFYYKCECDNLHLIQSMQHL